MGTSAQQRTTLSQPAFHVLLALAEGPLHGHAVMQHAAEPALQGTGKLARGSPTRTGRGVHVV